MRNLLKLKQDSTITTIIDIIRGLAIGLVIVVHWRNFVGQTGGLDAAFESGYSGLVDLFIFGASGVALFFMISGFLMDYLYKEKLNIKSFALKRMARIFPAWFFWHIIALIASMFALSWTFEGGDNIMKYVYGGIEPISNVQTASYFIVSLLFMGFISMNIWNYYIPGGWSIQAEMTHYAAFPWVNKRSTSYLLLLILLVQFVGLITGITLKSPIVASFVTSPFWFIIGIIFSRAIRNYKNNSSPLTRSEYVLIILNMVVTSFLSGPVVKQYITIIVIVLSLLASLLILKSTFITKIVTSIGKYSYGMYFNHFLLGVPMGFLASYIIEEFSLYEWLVIVMILGYIILTLVSFFFAKIMYNLYEKRFIIAAHKKASQIE